MSWANFHTESERLAAEAEVVLRQGDRERARDLYTQAAEAETRALEVVDPAKARTLGITAVSSISLWYKARQMERPPEVAFRWLSTGRLPVFAVEQIKSLLQSIWNEDVDARAGGRARSRRGHH
jgi:hypothetical protein